ncbi:PREDICTED: uncharacterized protein LOC104606892 [Nelumbo nucifera]|uniref:DC1 domain-containing protein n=2 Tax=Nelumbo nucifera TaxID=4432 RepID=A0A822ZNG8_NELNU|nr:PREDICTED: uncharacterized protein LOC104606892 [Nelumbo nucifera]DAD46447.1 TPA_asm: hypothetical protein HUJ06_016384 [Nelumbo nucifera]
METQIIPEEKITHFSHPQHPLVQINLPYLFTCMGCKEYGAGKRLTCQHCDFFLHDLCAFAPPSLSNHSLHSQHHLVFYIKPGGILRSTCDICGKSTRGYAFRCSTCNFEMHPCCAKLCREMDFPVHPHTLKLVTTATLTSGDPDFTCNECNTKRGGRIYGCTVCDYHLHAVCAKNMINGLHASGIIKVPEKPSRLGAAVRLVSNVVVGFIGGLLEGIGEGVGQAIFDSIVKTTAKRGTRLKQTREEP